MVAAKSVDVKLFSLRLSFYDLNLNLSKTSFRGAEIDQKLGPTTTIFCLPPTNISLESLVDDKDIVNNFRF